MERLSPDLLNNIRKYNNKSFYFLCYTNKYFKNIIGPTIPQPISVLDVIGPGITVELLEWILSKTDQYISVLYQLAKVGNLDCLVYMIDFLNEEKNNLIRCITNLKTNEKTYLERELLKINRMDLIVYFQNDSNINIQRFKCIEKLLVIDDDMVTKFAIKSQNLECLKYLHECGYPLHKDSCKIAILHNSLDCLKYVFDNGCQIDEESINIATTKNRVEIFEYASRRCDFDEGVVCNNIARYGNLKLLKYSVSEDFIWSEDIIECAIESGDLKCVEYVIDHMEIEFPYIDSVCETAARMRNLECLKFLHNRGFPLVESIYHTAIYNDDVSILMYLHENGLPWGADTCKIAVREGKLASLMYIYQNGCPVSEDIDDIFLHIFGSDDVTNICCEQLECIKYLLKNGYQLSDREENILITEKVIEVIDRAIVDGKWPHNDLKCFTLC